MRWSFVFIALATVTALQVHARPAPDDMSGRVIAEHDGRKIELPLLDSALKVNIEGDMATVEVTQTFENPSQIPLEAEYLFPLNQNAAVYGMDMRVGDQVIQAVIRKKADAEAVFEQAKADGKAAALLSQHRPNMFTQRIANLMPGQTIEVRLRYVQMVPKIDDRYELVIPLIVGPRYQSALDQTDQLASTNPEANTWTVSDLPAYPPVAGLTLPDSVASDRVSLDLTMVSGIALGTFSSPTHPLAIKRDGDALSASFAEGKVMDNADLILHYTLDTQEVTAAALSHTDERGGFLSLMIEPPALPDDNAVAARELVFVLDTSGSMSGAPMAASKRFMQAALSGLRPDDYFRIIPFSNAARHFAAEAVPATQENLRTAARFVQNLTGGGGTEIDNAIRAAFTTRQPAETLRIVVFLSDGYIGNEAQVLKTIRDQIGSARIYAFGVGSSVNRYLLDGMADEGRGYARYVGLDEDALEVAEQLAANLKSPLLTDISIDWGDLDVRDVSPSRLPDLFAGNALRLYARHKASGQATITVTGLVNGRRATMPVTLSLTGDADEPALPLVWARNRIAHLERNVAVGADPIASDAEITRLGLAYSLQTKNTSFVAVSEQVVNPTGESATARVPLPMVKGVSHEAYPQAFAGSSTPEPQALFGLLIVAALTLVGLRRRVLQ